MAFFGEHAAAEQHASGPNVAAIRELPVSNHQGPDVNIPWTALPSPPLDVQLHDSATRLNVVQEQRRRQEQAITNGTRTQLELKQGQYKEHHKTAQMASSKQKLLALQHDPRWTELQDVLRRPDEATITVSSPHSSEVRDAKRQQWNSQLRQGLRKLLDTVMLCSEPEVAERQLSEAYSWFHASKKPGSYHRTPSSGDEGPHFNNFFADENLGERRIPGSAFFEPSPDSDLPADRSATLESVSSAQANTPMVAGRPVPNVQLASPKDRLKEFRTNQLVKPLTARRLRAANLSSETDYKERPLTPSTATGGGLTARSAASVRSMPTTLQGSRPSSAVSHYTVSSLASTVKPPATPRTGMGRYPRPTSAASMASVESGHAVPGLPLNMVNEYARPDGVYSGGEEGLESLAPYPATDAERKMEERWLVRRNRAIVNKVVSEEQRSAVKDWAERRARVEEEICRNAESARFQSDLQRRAYSLPDDAEQDIEATMPEMEVHGGVTVYMAAPKQASRRTQPVPRFDVNHAKSFTFQSAPRFEDSMRKKPPPLNSRIAHLRKIHANLIKEADDPEKAMSDDEGAAQEAIQNSLSAYAAAPGQQGPFVARMEDDSDVLVGVCDWWKSKHDMDAPAPADADLTLDEIRFKQMLEVEQVMRLFAKRHVPINVAVLERALVMPAHRLQPGAMHGTVIFNTTPNLMHNPFAVKASKKKGKKKGGGKKAAAKKGAGSKKK
mmetsp:Transcript_42520/g.76379  ORF Transcript_42520/g.76379 Transcript_42520/m.76379 type:complete len:727 (-) Transcript_42520:108-2288(-)|eukprot:CAMPEP_0197650284 /NCGR_PEP_ID=MMETSP1338-20131121/30843_1 /TAXON_ID=43686 ORGANISM="Pelagodinium beii, Strain RCC1491" /NCGR_SAMPLE_ID=MMETSP1338 /ASSEMBLY_ACC=CAM_ASM_000754 /LENGTH=726 /DNA_ID=CAMNT_0043224653 /DNA_START=122 /DNA_END=2302 /DNA_ORIENTATION=+